MENAAAMILNFINQSAPDIKRKLQRLEHLREKNIRELVEVAEKVYTGRDNEEKKEIKREQHKNQHLASVLLAITAETHEHQRQLRCLAAREENEKPR
ncbi:hypothetical protein STEG23_024433, partial [Scotinomys teguina]